jgi:molybdate transport system substrate-binding protein
MKMKLHRPDHRLIFAGLLLALSSQAHADTLTVAVAASAQYAFAELQSAFHEQSGHELKPVLGSSGKLSAQIMHGAPFDVFLSADMAYPQKLFEAGLSTRPKTYAYGALVLWTMNDLDLGNWQRALPGAGIRKIAVANPKIAPYGQQAMKALEHFGLDQTLKPKLVIGESVSQVNQYIHSRSADAGFTAKSVVVSPAMKGRGKWIELPKESYEPIAQGIVVLKHGQQFHREAAVRFHDFMFTPLAQAILKRYGYLLP